MLTKRALHGILGFAKNVFEQYRLCWLWKKQRTTFAHLLLALDKEAKEELKKTIDISPSYIEVREITKHLVLLFLVPKLLSDVVDYNILVPSKRYESLTYICAFCCNYQNVGREKVEKAWARAKLPVTSPSLLLSFLSKTNAMAPNHTLV